MLFMPQPTDSARAAGLQFKPVPRTSPERCLWSRLRGRRLDGVKFRPQQVLGPYVADFLCLEPKVVIEVNGSQHAAQVSDDLQRTEYLKVLGYRVIRFWNHDVLGDPDAVLESIRAALVEIPSPPPSPGGPGGRGS